MLRGKGDKPCNGLHVESVAEVKGSREQVVIRAHKIPICARCIIFSMSDESEMHWEDTLTCCKVFQDEIEGNNTNHSQVNTPAANRQ